MPLSSTILFEPKGEEWGYDFSVETAPEDYTEIPFATIANWACNAKTIEIAFNSFEPGEPIEPPAYSITRTARRVQEIAVPFSELVFSTTPHPVLYYDGPSLDWRLFNRLWNYAEDDDFPISAWGFMGEFFNPKYHRGKFYFKKFPASLSTLHEHTINFSSGRIETRLVSDLSSWYDTYDVTITETFFT